MKTVRIIVESPDTGIVLVDVTAPEGHCASRTIAQLARRYRHETVRKLGAEYTGCGNLTGRRVPAFPPRG